MSDLTHLLFPRSVAIVGASPRRAESIETTLRSGVRAWGVNPGRDAVGDLRCYPSIADLPEIPDVAFVLVGHERVEEAVRDALAAGVRGFVVPGVGAEAGAAARDVAERLGVAVRDAGAAMVGPNCMGVFVPDGASTWIGEPTGTTASGHVAVLCQSGSIADAFLSLGGRIGMRCIVSTGGEAATDAADYLDFFAGDDGTRAIGLFLEAVRRPAAFAAALARCAAMEKPVVCLKVGRSEAAAHAALSHTGALVGSVEAFSAMLHRYGAIEVDDFHELVETLEILGGSRWPRGTRLGAISESGGECALLADQAEAAGIPFTPLPADLAAALSAEFPNYVRPGNPLDAWAVADEELVFPRSLELMADSGAFDGLLALADLSQFRDRGNEAWCELTLRTLAHLAAEHAGLFVAGVSVHNGDPPRRFQELSRDLDLPLLRGPRDAVRAIASVAHWRPARVAGDDGDAPDVSDLLSPGVLPEHESALVLERYGVPFTPHRRAETPDEAAVAAVELGFPVVIKTDGKAHKAREGGVVLGVSTALQAAEEARRLGDRVLVARQVDFADEAICGMTRDPDYGPVLAVGPGGVAVEELNRLTLTLAPLDLETAREVVAEAGVEDVGDVVATTLVALGRLALKHPEVESVDVNPLVLSAGGAVAVDALIVVSSTGSTTRTV